MDSSYPPYSTDDFMRLNTQLKSISNVQVEHSDRLLRLERRMEDDSRIKSVWGTSSPFPGILGGTSQQDSLYNPAAEAFKTFDQDQTAGMLGSLQLDHDEEPRRGASRANSVRFDESALHGHFGHNSRSSSEFFPVRTSSGLGSHPLTERSSSHKSDGRQSSAGQSAHSTRLNSLGQDTRSPGLTMALPSGPPPGLLILGPLPGIIRCWLDTNFSNDTLLYAAICSGSYKSIISSSTLEQLGYESQAIGQGHTRSVKLRVYLPEATIRSVQSRAASPAPQLPHINVTFEVSQDPCELDAIGIVLGSDVLRAKNADILFSKNMLTILDDDHNRLEVPLVRPEKDSSFNSLVTFSGLPMSYTTLRTPIPAESRSRSRTLPGDDPSNQSVSVSTSSQDFSRVVGQPADKSISKTPVPSSHQGGIAEHLTTSIISPKPEQAPKKASPNVAGISTDFSSSGSWRRNAQSPNSESTFSSVASGLGATKAVRGKDMKVLKSARSGGSRSTSLATASSGESPQFWQSEGFVHTPKTPRDVDEATDTRSPRQGPQDGKKFANPAGGGSAFGWLNNGNAR